MSETLTKVRALVAGGEVRVSLHGYDELVADRIFFTDVLGGVSDAVVVEDYPQTAKGPCVLVLQKDSEGRPIHVVWGPTTQSPTTRAAVPANYEAVRKFWNA